MISWMGWTVRRQAPLEKATELVGQMLGHALPFGIGGPSVDDEERRIGADDHVGNNVRVHVCAHATCCLLLDQMVGDGSVGVADVSLTDRRKLAVAKHLGGVHAKSGSVVPQRCQVIQDEVVQHLPQGPVAGFLQNGQRSRQPRTLAPTSLDQGRLAGEVVVQKPLRDAHGTRNVPDGCRLVTLLAEQTDGRLEYLGTAMFVGLPALVG